MKFSDIIPGTTVIVNSCGDAMMCADIKHYISTPHKIIPLEVVKVTKSGLIQLKVSEKQTISVPLTNIEPVPIQIIG